MNWYPGDEYVDWVGISYFNQSQQYKAAEISKKAKELHKPLMIAEATPAGIFTERGKIAYLESLFNVIKREQVQLVSYINCNWDSFPMFKNDHWGDSRIQFNPVVKEYWMKKITSPNIMQSSPDLFEKLKSE
jgi:hypothetical protein